MSCSAGRLVSYYSDKVNIYNSNCFIPLPNYRTCPPPSMIMIGPNPNSGPPMRPPPPPNSSCGPCRQNLK